MAGMVRQEQAKERVAYDLDLTGARRIPPRESRIEEIFPKGWLSRNLQSPDLLDRLSLLRDELYMVAHGPLKDFAEQYPRRQDLPKAIPRQTVAFICEAIEATGSRVNEIEEMLDHHVELPALRELGLILFNVTTESSPRMPYPDIDSFGKALDFITQAMAQVDGLVDQMKRYRTEHFGQGKPPSRRKS